MTLYADLHLHTTASDGSLSPAEVVDRAAELGLRVIAITDHDTVQGIQAAQQRGEELGVQVIPGIELSVRSDKEEVHLLGYGIDVNDPQLHAHLENFQSDRLRRIERMVERLVELGYHLTVAEVLEAAGDGSPGRPHVARVLVDKGYFSSVSDVFDELLKEGRPGYVPRQRLSLAEGVELIHRAGGLAVCAHPGLLKEPGEVLQTLVAAGLDGIEVIHSEHDPADRDRFASFALEHGLLRTGGSDCHGPGVKREVYIGRFSIPKEWVDALLAKWQERQTMAE